MQYIALILFFLLMLLVCGGALWWFFYCKKEPKYNGLLWVHPDLNGGVIGIKKEPGLQHPYYFNYRLLEFNLPYFRKPIYLWKQDKITDEQGNVSYPIVHWEPTVPADFMLQSTADGEPDTTSPYVTPNNLFNTTDWSALRVMETAPKQWHEAVKTGVAVLLGVVCVVGMIMTVDMIGKKEPSQQPVQTAKPMSQTIQPQDYGGISIW